MTGRKEERERLREERLAAQRAAQSSDKRRLYLGYAVAGLIVAAMLAGIFIVVTGGNEGEETGVDSEGNAFPELAFVNDEIGAVPDGIEFDGREGTKPPPQENAVLEDAAKLAGCELQLDLEDEGNTHIEDEDAADVNYKTDPPTSGDHYGNGNETASGALADGAYLEFPAGRALGPLDGARPCDHPLLP